MIGRCVICLRQIIRRPHMQEQMKKLEELDPVIGDMTRKRLEQGWSLQRVGDLYKCTRENVRQKERYAILYLRRACGGKKPSRGG